MSPIVIIGSGLAGWTVARELRKLDRNVPVTLVTGDEGHFYPKPSLSNAFAQGKAPEALVTTPADAMAARENVTLRPGTRVLAIDRTAKRIHTDGGPVPYGRLVLALGADPIRLTLRGDTVGAVMSVNDLGDYARFRAALENAESVAILGAGLIGCEFANDLAGGGFRVTVIDPSAWPLASLIPEAAGRQLQQALEAAGIEWRLGRTATAVDRSAPGLCVTLSDDSTVEVDAVLSAVGLRPRAELARAAGLALNRGIAVDAELRTSDPDIFALGDCAEIEGRVRPYVLPIMHAARALAATLAGTPTPVRFPPMPVVVKTPACPIAVSPVVPGTSGNWESDAAAGGLRLTFGDAQRLLGFVLTGSRTAERNELAKRLAA